MVASATAGDLPLVGTGPRSGMRVACLRWGHVLASAVAASAAIYGVSAQAKDLDFKLLWTRDLKTFTESGPTVADIDGDGHKEAIVAGREEIITLDGKGAERWRWRTKGRFMTYPSVLARKGLPSLIYAADDAGILTCLDGTGHKVWQAQLSAPSTWSAAAVCDLDRDGTSAVVQTDEKGTVWAFNALVGKVLWQAQVQGKPVSPAVGDIDGDGKAEAVVVTGKGRVTAVSHDGKVLWDREIGGTSETWATSAPVIFSASDGRARVVAASNAGQVFCFDGRGTPLWQRPTRGPVASTISVGDLDMDGRADVFLITQLGVIHRFGEGGDVLWEIDMQGRSLAAGAIIDADGDGRLEYVFSTQNGHLMVLDVNGEFVFDRQFDCRTINVTPAFGDVTPESSGLEMLITGGESGKVFCFGAHAPVDALSHWAAYRGNEQKTGAWFGLTRRKDVARMVAEDLAWDQVLGGRGVRFAISNPNPGPEPLRATCACIGPDGMRQAATSRVVGRRGHLLLPVTAIVPGVYRFSWNLSDSGGRELDSGTREICLQPFANDRAVVARGIEDLRASANKVAAVLPLPAAALRSEARAIEQEAAAAISGQQTVPGGDASKVKTILDKTALLVARAQRAMGVAEVVRRAVTFGSSTSVVAFEGTLWESRAVDEQLPKQAGKALKLRRRLVPGEHEPVALGVFNVTDRPLQVRALINVAPGGPIVTPHRSVSVPTSLGGEAWDALPELDESAVVTVLPLKSAELWLDCDAGGARPGRYTITVRLYALNGVGVIDGSGSPQTVPPPETSVEVVLDVLPFEMAPSGTFRLCAWATLDAPAIADMLAHGNNVFVGPHGVPKYDSQGALTGFDYTQHDAFVAPFSKKDVMLLLSGIPGLRGGLGSAAYARDLKTYLRDLVARMAGKGFDRNHFALYPVDEPGGQGWNAVNKVVEFGKAVRAADPGIKIYIDGGGERPMFEAMAPYVDIWCPGIMQLAEDSPEMKVVRASGKTLWSYDCGYAYARPVGPNIKDINIVGQFRTAALFAMRHGAAGIGFWSYNIGDDPWGRTGMEYPLVYPGRTRPVTSRRWEAVREGIEDCRILAALQRRLGTAGDAKLSDEASARIRSVLEVRLPELVDQSFREVSLGLARDVLDASANDSTIATFRKEMMDCVELVAGPKRK
jgi:outer membrane protein assembly factor BamB